MSDSIREALQASVEELQEAEPAPLEAAETPVEAQPGLKDDVPEEAHEEAPPAREGRDEKGRFAAKAKEAAEKAAAVPGEAPKPTPPATGEATQAEAPKAPAEAVRAPQAFSPLEREAFTKADPVIQRALARRENEYARGIQESSEARKGYEAFRQTVQPYEHLIRAEGGEPLKAVASLLQTAAALRTAPPAHRAQLVASIVRTYGVPIDALDAALSGQAPQGGQAQSFDPSQLAQQVRQQVMQDFQQARQQSAQQKAQQELQAFQAQAEFYEDVREDMSDLLEVASKRGRTLSLSDAYSRAVAMNPELSRVMAQREAAAAAAKAQASTQRGRAAASSVKSQPAAQPAGSSNGSLRDTIRATARELSGT